MMRETYGISYCALSGLEDFLFAFYTGLHPVLTDYALSGLSEILLSKVGSDSMGIFFCSERRDNCHHGLKLRILIFEPRNLSNNI